MITRIESRDIFIDRIINPFKNKKVIIITTEEYICSKFNIDLSENRDKNIDTDSLEFKNAKTLFESIEKQIIEKGACDNYCEISPRLDAVIISTTDSSINTLVDFIKTEIDIVQGS
jgi:hypothetical protein